VGDLPNVLAAQDKRAVHDLRVWSRRLQQILVALCGDKPSRQVRSMRTALKRTRRALGPWRNHDVVLETLIRLERRARSAERRQAWKIVSEAAVAERKREVRRARKRLMKLDIFGLIEAVESLIADSPNGSRATIDASFWGAMTAAFDEWRTALSAAVKSMSPDDIHALRICTKRLRYRIELARELGVEETGSLLTWCRRLQNELGRWRDRLELERVVARTLADPDLLISQPRVGIILLSELDRVQRMAARAMHREILAVEGGSGLPKLEAWLRGHLDGRANAVGGQ
jgi:CHAD domain-containing protein